MADDLPETVRAASHLLNRELTVRKVYTAGQHANTLLVTDGDTDFVVRGFPPHDDASMREAEILNRVRTLGPLVPRLVAVGDDRDKPVIITSVVPGTIPHPELPLDIVASRMAEALARIHRFDGSGLRAEPAQRPLGSSEIARRAQRDWDSLDTDEQVLTHFDFWCGNALWEGERLTGVVDWSGARSGPRGIDLAWCRQDLVLLGSATAAELFLQKYQQELGRTIADIRAWDVQAAAKANDVVETWLPNYLGIGRTEITEQLLWQRLDAWISTL